MRFSATSLMLLLTMFITGSAFAYGERINHIPIGSGSSGRSIQIEAVVEDGLLDPVRANIYFRISGEAVFRTAEMLIEQRTMSGEIPADEIKPPGLEYYIVATMEGGGKIQFPSGAPDLTQPLSVVVKDAVESAFGKEGVFVLSPDPGIKMTDGQVLIAFSINQNIHKINLDNLIIKLDGKNLTNRANMSEGIVALTVTGVVPGIHYVTVDSKEDGKSERLADWVFHIQSREEIKRAERSLDGRLNLGYSHENVSEDVRNITYADGRLNGKLSGMEWATRIYLTNRERGNLQPQNRFLLSVKYGGLTLRGGDFYPRISEFTAWGLRTRGAEAVFISDYFNLNVAWGYTRRATEGEGTYDTTFVTPDSMQIDPRIIRAGNYERQLLAIRPAFPITRHAILGINILKSKDGLSSIDWGSAPKDNLVIGADLKIKSPDRRVQFSTETAISLYNRDFSDGAMEDARDFEDFIVINQYFDPLPSDSSILEEGLSVNELAGKLIDEITKSSLAHRSSLILNYFNNELRLGYKTIGRSFHSLGSPSILTDVAGFSLQDRLRLLKNRLYLTLGYEEYANNINERSPTTLERNIIRGSIAYYSPVKYPNINFGLRLYDRVNDGERVENIISIEDTIVTDTRIDQQTFNYNLGINQVFKTGQYVHTASLLYNSTISEDYVFEGQDADVVSLNLNLVSRFGGFLETRLAYNNSVQKSMSGGYKVDYNTISVYGRYTILPRRLWIDGGLYYTTASGGNDLVNPEPVDVDPDEVVWESMLDFNRLKFSLGIEYNLSDKHEIEMNAYQVDHTDDGYTSYYSTRKEYSRETSLSRDDLVVRLRYEYKF